MQNPCKDNWEEYVHFMFWKCFNICSFLPPLDILFIYVFLSFSLSLIALTITSSVMFINQETFFLIRNVEWYRVKIWLFLILSSSNWYSLCSHCKYQWIVKLNPYRQAVIASYQLAIRRMSLVLPGVLWRL